MSDFFSKRLKKEREKKKKKIKENIPKDLEDIGIWNNIETIENNLAKMKTKLTRFCLQ
jgi:hypothetical protein